MKLCEDAQIAAEGWVVHQKWVAVKCLAADHPQHIRAAVPTLTLQWTPAQQPSCSM